MRRPGVVVAVVGVFAMVMLGVAALAGADRPTKVKQGHLPIRFSASVTPKALPARDAAPARLRLRQLVRTEDGSHPPALKLLEIELDRDISLDSGGVPTCERRLRDAKRHSRGWYERRCRGAQVGRGQIDVEVQFVDQLPVTVHSPISIYNGGAENGQVTLYVFAYFNAPITGSIVAAAKSKRIAGGRNLITIRFPIIGNGAGSITDLRLDLGQRIVSARCRDRRLQFQASAAFYDGAKRRDVVSRSCSRRM